jgi:hypothetical protein
MEELLIFLGKNCDPSVKTVGEIVAWSLCRKTKIPKFEIYFEEVEVTYNKLDLDYESKYSDELPLEYNALKAAYIVRLATEAATKVSSVTTGDAAIDDSHAQKMPAEELKEAQEVTTPSNKTEKRFSEANEASMSKKGKKKMIMIEEDDGSDFEVLEFTNEDDNKRYDAVEEEVQDYAADFLKAISETPVQFDPSLWQVNKLPVQFTSPFTGHSGPQHCLPPDQVGPLDYFAFLCPFICGISGQPTPPIPKLLLNLIKRMEKLDFGKTLVELR